MYVSIAQHTITRPGSEFIRTRNTGNIAENSRFIYTVYQNSATQLETLENR